MRRRLAQTLCLAEVPAAAAAAAAAALAPGGGLAEPALAQADLATAVRDGMAGDAAPELPGLGKLAVFQVGDCHHAAAGGRSDRGIRMLGVPDPAAITAAGELADDDDDDDDDDGGGGGGGGGGTAKTCLAAASSSSDSAQTVGVSYPSSTSGTDSLLNIRGAPGVTAFQIAAATSSSAAGGCLCLIDVPDPAATTLADNRDGA